MLNILRASWRTGRVTAPYPAQTTADPCRGRPQIEPLRCDRSGACAGICPSGAITLSSSPSGVRWQLDLARCVFCGLCEEACPNGAITMTADFELAARRREDLIVGVTHASSNGRAVTANHNEIAAATRSGRFSVAATGTSTDAPDLSPNHLGNRIRGLLKRSLHIRHMAAGSDNSSDWEIAHLLNPVHDIQRLGIDFVASPRHADLLLVTGAVTRNLQPALMATYEAMPAPRLVVAVGDEACGGGVLQGAYAVAGGVDRCLPVDVYIPGDPPRPQAIIQGLLIALDRLEPKIRRLELSTGS